MTHIGIGQVIGGGNSLAVRLAAHGEGLPAQVSISPNSDFPFSWCVQVVQCVVNRQFGGLIPTVVAQKCLRETRSVELGSSRCC
jgi:hypothetical protein